MMGLCRRGSGGANLTMGQFLTAVLEMHPTRRKAAALERVRAANEEAFWESLAGAKDQAEAIIAMPKKEHRRALRQACKGVPKIATKHKLIEAVAHGLSRDVEMAVSSYIELKAGGHEATWPERDMGQRPDMGMALDQLAAAITIEDESAARDALAKARKIPAVRGLTFARSRDARIIQDSAGRIAVVLNCLKASDPHSREAVMREGVDPTTGEVLRQAKSKAKLVIPLACSRWHQNKFLSGKAILRSSLVFKRGERWFIAAQFEMPDKQAVLSGSVLGIDRGIVFPVSVGVVDKDGALLDLEAPAGNEIGKRIKESDERRKMQAQRRGFTTFRHQEVVHHSLHRLANEIVKTATRYGAEVAVEKLGEMKKVITTARPTGARKGGWRRSLKKAQLGELEQILSYKLKLAGFPKVREVVAAGTSMTCPACGHKAKENRPERDVFKCVACGHAAHADQNASIIIARRGVLMRKLKKGDKLDALHMDMVASLRTRGDGGLGRRELFTMVVPAHVSGAEANEGKASLLTSAPGQEVTLVDQNVPTGVLAERIGAFSGVGKHRIREPDQ